MNWFGRALLCIPRWVSTVAVTAAVLYLTLVPHPLPRTGFHFWVHTDKLVHALMMCGIACALALDLRRGDRLSPKLIVTLIVAVTAFGGAIELAQHYMRLGRGGDMADLLADFVGTLFFPLFYRVAFWR